MIRPGFSGTVLIFNDVSWKKIIVLHRRPFVPFLAWCPGFVPICPFLQPYAYASVAKNWLILSVYTKKSQAAAGRLKSSRRSPDLQIGP